jgi:hypothetical protein
MSVDSGARDGHAVREHAPRHPGRAQHREHEPVGHRRRVERALLLVLIAGRRDLDPERRARDAQALAAVGLGLAGRWQPDAVRAPDLESTDRGDLLILVEATSFDPALAGQAHVEVERARRDIGEDEVLSFSSRLKSRVYSPLARNLEREPPAGVRRAVRAFGAARVPLSVLDAHLGDGLPLGIADRARDEVLRSGAREHHLAHVHRCSGCERRQRAETTQEARRDRVDCDVGRGHAVELEPPIGTRARVDPPVQSEERADVCLEGACLVEPGGGLRGVAARGCHEGTTHGAAVLVHRPADDRAARSHADLAEDLLARPFSSALQVCVASARPEALSQAQSCRPTVSPVWYGQESSMRTSPAASLSSLSPGHSSPRVE